jgi:hypothetical protein
MSFINKKIKNQILVVKKHEQTLYRSKTTLLEAANRVDNARNAWVEQEATYENALSLISSYMKSTHLCPIRITVIQADFAMQASSLEQKKLALDSAKSNFQQAKMEFSVNKSQATNSQEKLDKLKKNVEAEWHKQKDLEMSDLYNMRRVAKA